MSVANEMSNWSTWVLALFVTAPALDTRWGSWHQLLEVSVMAVDTPHVEATIHVGYCLDLVTR